jgi:hypothetical protein
MKRYGVQMAWRWEQVKTAMAIETVNHNCTSFHAHQCVRRVSPLWWSDSNILSPCIINVGSVHLLATSFEDGDRKYLRNANNIAYRHIYARTKNLHFHLDSDPVFWSTLLLDVWSAGLFNNDDLTLKISHRPMKIRTNKKHKERIEGRVERREWQWSASTSSQHLVFQRLNIVIHKN